MGAWVEEPLKWCGKNSSGLLQLRCSVVYPIFSISIDNFGLTKVIAFRKQLRNTAKSLQHCPKDPWFSITSWLNEFKLPEFEDGKPGMDQVLLTAKAIPTEYQGQTRIRA